MRQCSPTSSPGRWCDVEDQPQERPKGAVHPEPHPPRLDGGCRGRAGRHPPDSAGPVTYSERTEILKLYRSAEGSSSGRTAGSDPANEGSNPSPSAILTCEDVGDAGICICPEIQEVHPAGRSSNGKTVGCDPANGGSNPSPLTIIPDVWALGLIPGMNKLMGFGEPDPPEAYCSECGAHL